MEALTAATQLRSQRQAKACYQSNTSNAQVKYSIHGIDMKTKSNITY
jgi:hypothetical protein